MFSISYMSETKVAFLKEGLLLVSQSSLKPFEIGFIGRKKARPLKKPFFVLDM